MNELHDLETALMRRVVPKAPDDLANRIIYRAVRTPQTVAAMTWRGVVNECLSFLVIPRPAVAFGFCLMIGLFSGWAATQNADADDTTQAINMVVIEEDWL